MSRRHRHEEHVNHEAWVIPYADLLTLLLALFVVLYAMSSVNNTKYRALAQAISSAFNGSHAVIVPVAPKAPAPSVPAPTTKSAPLPQLRLPQQRPTVAAASLKPITPSAADLKAEKLSEEQQNLERIRNEVEHALQPLIEKNLVLVRRTPNWLEIEIRTDILFPSGVATLAPSANSVLANLGSILAPFANPLRVEGYTDDMPIDTATYPSNWELSAARAASVARLFAQHGVDPQRLGIVGWGQYRPATDNDSADGRNKNRRVLVVVLSDKAGPRRFYTNSDALNTTADEDSSDEAGRGNDATAAATSASDMPAATAGSTLPASKITMPIATAALPAAVAPLPHPSTPDSKG